MEDLLERLKTALADRYRIERELGAGGMATVYLADDLKHHRQVALKLLRPELGAVLGGEGAKWGGGKGIQGAHHRHSEVY